jgi:archaeosine synthase beta-subunit
MKPQLLDAHRRISGGMEAIRQPHACFIERERNSAGAIVPVVTILLKNRRCPWRCVYCDLWKNALEFTVPEGAIPAQIDFALRELAGRGDSPAKLVKLYNAGSFFDRAAIPSQDFPAIAERVRDFERVIVESHPALVGAPAIRFRDLLRATLDESPSTLEVAMGLEIANDEILRRLNKRMTLAMFARAAEFLREYSIALRAFVMIKPPFVTSDAAAVEFAVRSAEFAFDCGATAVSLIPTRFGTEELDMLGACGEFAPPGLSTVEAALDAALSLHRGRVFVDLWNLELFSSCSSCFPARRERLQRINEQQCALPDIRCECEQAHST